MDKKDLERLMRYCHSCGMNHGYGVKHENITEDEELFQKSFIDSNLEEMAKRYGIK